MADAEIDAMSVVADALTNLEEGARARVLQWAASRFGVSILDSEGDGSDGTGTTRGSGGDRRDNKGEDDEGGGCRGSYEYFADLFDEASPTSNPDKALVAAYWVQVHGGHQTWGSYELNKELKNLGHGVPEIHKALGVNMKKNPKLVIQIKKSSSSQQARKTYKVTVEGIKYVQKMLVPAA